MFGPPLALVARAPRECTVDARITDAKAGQVSLNGFRFAWFGATARVLLPQADARATEQGEWM